MDALNRAFEKAFLHSEGNDNISELIADLGEEMGCCRVSIFEENDEGTCDNTYEWCRPGVIREQILLQHVEVARFDTWHDRLANRETIVVRNREDLKDHDPDVYRMFVEEEIHTAIVTLLAFHGRTFGFCILEDPSEPVMDDAAVIIPGIRYILSSMIYSRNLVHRLRRAPEYAGGGHRSPSLGGLFVPAALVVAGGKEPSNPHKTIKTIPEILPKQAGFRVFLWKNGAKHLCKITKICGFCRVI
jgi:hypothetical protein